MPPHYLPRPAQKKILAYRGGTMGVSAVPGSGKTWTLSLLAAELINSGILTADQEVLVVTLVNSAVNNFSKRISTFLQDMGRLPSLGYRVRTLHGLAHDIVKERPDLVGLDSKFQIIDEREADRIRVDAVYDWLKKNPSAINYYINLDLNDKKRKSIYQKQIPNLMVNLAHQFIRTAKNYQASPDFIQSRLKSTSNNMVLAEMGASIFSVYQRNLEYRGAVDFDDLINHAYQILQLDSSLLNRLQSQWPFILEDEAQDSSLMQQKILSLLSGSTEAKNWVRVGDPNQAIYESFTTADPKLLQSFIEQADQSHILPNSGRSTEDIINLANYLVDWVTAKHPQLPARDALYPNKILPTPTDDLQPNPENIPGQIYLFEKELTPEKEIQVIADSVVKWLSIHPDKTVAVLSPRNDRGKKLAGYLRENFDIDPVEYLNSTLATRKTTGSLVIILSYLIDPNSSNKLAAVYKVCKRDLKSNEKAWAEVQVVSSLIKSIQRPEIFLNPGPSINWMSSLDESEKVFLPTLSDFRDIIHKWQEASLLPIDQLILTISSDIFHTPEELSISHKIANFQKQLSTQHPDWELPALLDELKSLARNERRFFSISEDSQFNPEDHKGKVVITTAHKAKGLEWDRVYLISANSYNFPSNLPGDDFISERWFIRDNLNLPAESLAQLINVLNDSEADYLEGEASSQSRIEYVRERLRLLYVSITRAKQEFVMTWNNGRSGKSTPAVPFQALIDYTSRNQTNSPSLPD
ncbi:MAG: ATP-dependent helicase [Anaerolineales bacterium]|nr:ATP-dependent helicase [Anaerolineales bacterium]